ncbi:hypothetical protein GGP45_003093 [Salinibacter ruber]|uniref:Uncharacterized protein n=1 Tax=Salinibacter ruber TaxID=146919 RepID=A0A9X3AAA9_9BACT|nr:hypothetical protein [Salinibacter ruber]
MYTHPAKIIVFILNVFKWYKLNSQTKTKMFYFAERIRLLTIDLVLFLSPTQ